jgi:hypothetical protein
MRRDLHHPVVGGGSSDIFGQFVWKSIFLFHFNLLINIGRDLSPSGFRAQWGVLRRLIWLGDGQLAFEFGDGFKGLRGLNRVGYLCLRLD